MASVLFAWLFMALVAPITAGAGFAPVSALTMLLAAAMFALVLAVWRIVSLASLVAVTVVPLILIAIDRLGSWPVSRGELAFALAASAIVVWAQRANLSRLRAGTEPRISERSR